MKIVGEELAGRTPLRPASSPPPCIICGVASGACVGEDEAKEHAEESAWRSPLLDEEKS